MSVEAFSWAVNLGSGHGRGGGQRLQVVLAAYNHTGLVIVVLLVALAVAASTSVPAASLAGSTSAEFGGQTKPTAKFSQPHAATARAAFAVMSPAHRLM